MKGGPQDQKENETTQKVKDEESSIAHTKRVKNGSASSSFLMLLIFPLYSAATEMRKRAFQ